MNDPTRKESPEHEINDPSPSDTEGMRDPEAPEADDPMLQPDITGP
jgi:hypothetical protein